jgi:altronate dehydratase
MQPRFDLTMLHGDDDVAVALRDLDPGPARLRGGGEIVLNQAIPLGHKVARHAVARGTPVRKYGAVIGEATADIAAGAHVHVHNLRSLRARRKEDPA